MLIEIDDLNGRELLDQLKCQGVEVAVLDKKDLQKGWIDEFGNVFPLGAYSTTGKTSYIDADKRGWKPLYAAHI